jgi:hypothetical protein
MSERDAISVTSDAFIYRFKENIEKIGSCFGGKTIITDIRTIGHLSFHSFDRKKICTSILFNILPSFQYISNIERPSRIISYSINFPLLSLLIVIEHYIAI